MASFGKQFSCFLLYILFFVSHQTEAREIKFVSKYIHLTKNTNKNYVTIPSTTNFAKKDVSLPSLPSPAPAPVTNYISNAPTPLGSTEYGYAPTPLDNAHSSGPSPSPSLSPVESENFYYGLYAKGTNGFVSETTTNVDNEQEKDEFSGEEFSNEDSELLNSRKSNKFADSYPDNLNEENGLGTSNQEGYNNNLNNFDVGYTSEPQGMSDTRLVDNGKYYYGAEQENYVPIGQETISNNDGGYVGYTSEPQGMSDTRLVDNGKYYYGAEQENYVPIGRETRSNNDGGYFGHYDPKSKFEFDTMEAYEKQEGYPEYRQEFIP